MRSVLVVAVVIEIVAIEIVVERLFGVHVLDVAERRASVTLRGWWLPIPLLGNFDTAAIRIRLTHGSSLPSPGLPVELRFDPLRIAAAQRVVRELAQLGFELQEVGLVLWAAFGDLDNVRDGGVLDVVVAGCDQRIVEQRVEVFEPLSELALGGS